MVSSTGENLSVLLCCSHLLHHNWMSFLSWYSFQQNLPDAKFAILCSRKDIKYDLFQWTKRVNIPFEITNRDEPISCFLYALYKSYIHYPFLVITPDILCLKDLTTDDQLINTGNNYQLNKCFIIHHNNSYAEEKKDFFVNVKDQNASRFVSYSEGWGNFNTHSWINKLGNPLHIYSKYDSIPLNMNERRLSNIWKDACKIFHSIC